MKTVITTIIALAFSAVMHAKDVDHVALARGFVVKCLSDTNVFIYNPPADLNPYKDMSREELERYQFRVMKDGSMLILNFNGLPAKFYSRRNFKESGLHKTWYQNGRISSEEDIEDRKIIKGIYFDKSGEVLGRIEKGTGVKINFRKQLGKSNGKIRGIADYVNGLKHGISVSYRDYEKHLKSSESHYKEGKLHGVMITWRPTGEKNSEQNYKNGLRHGKSIHWYKNGQIKSICEYIDGKQVGIRINYYENGVKEREISKTENKRWFTSGQLMLQKTLAKSGKVSSGKSFDSLGNQNGSVVNGMGSLILENNELQNGYQLIIFGHKKTTKSIQLPKPWKSYSINDNVVDLNLYFEVPRNATWEKGTVSLILPDDCKSQDQLQFVVSNLKSGSISKFGPIMITMPEPPDRWSGKALVDMQGVINGYKVRYQQPIFVKLAKTEKKNQSSIQKSEPLPRRTRPISLWMRKKPAPQVDGKTIPPYSQAVDYWQLSKTRWMLYKSPPLLLISKDSGKTWEVGRSDFAYRPFGLYVSSTNSMLIWGTKPTRDVNKGIVYVVEESKDGGNSWSDFKIPKADFLLSITGDNEKNLTVSAIRIPKEGIPEGKDWFEMPRTTFMSRDGTNFTEIVGPSFFDIEKVHTKSIAPNGKFRVFLSVFSWLDTSYTLYLAKGPDEIPIQTTLPASKCEIVWSPNSRILALKRKGKFFAYIDTESGESDNCNIPNKRSNSRKEKAKLVKFDKKVSELIKINTEPQTELEKKSISE